MLGKQGQLTAPDHCELERPDSQTSLEHCFGNSTGLGPHKALSAGSAQLSPGRDHQHNKATSADWGQNRSAPEGGKVAGATVFHQGASEASQDRRV